MRLLPERHADGGGGAARGEPPSRATPTSTRRSRTCAAAAPTRACASRSSRRRRRCAPRAVPRRRARRRHRDAGRRSSHETTYAVLERPRRHRRAARRLGRAAAAQPHRLRTRRWRSASAKWHSTAGSRSRPTARSRLAMHRAEMGQGVHTALATLVAEELDVAVVARRAVRRRRRCAVRQRREQHRDAAAAPRNQRAGPRDARRARQPLDAVQGVARARHQRHRRLVEHRRCMVAAAARRRHRARAVARGRRIALEAAGGRAERPATAWCGTASGQSAHYGELATQAAATPPGRVSTKPPEQWTLIGRTQPRSNRRRRSMAARASASTCVCRVMLFASVRHCPMLGGSAGRIGNVDEACKRPGVERWCRCGAYAGSTARRRGGRPQHVARAARRRRAGGRMARATGRRVPIPQRSSVRWKPRCAQRRRAAAASPFTRAATPSAPCGAARAASRRCIARRISRMPRSSR